MKKISSDGQPKPNGKSDAFGNKKRNGSAEQTFSILPTQKVCLILIKNEITAAGTCKLDNFLFRNSFPNAQHQKMFPYNVCDEWC